MKSLCFLLLLLTLPMLNCRAEKAWDDGYRPYQDVAPEYLEIRVTQAQVKGAGSFYASSSTVELRAEVTQVFRSSSGLAPGNPITIRFKRKSQAGSATLEPSIPVEGKVVPAFLRKKGNVYEPAALHHTFEPLSSQQLMVLSKSNPSKRIVSPPSPFTSPQKTTTASEEALLIPAIAEPTVTETKSRLEVTGTEAVEITNSNTPDFTDASAPVIITSDTVPTTVIDENLPERGVVETPVAAQIIETSAPSREEPIVVTSPIVVSKPATIEPSLAIINPEPELGLDTPINLESPSPTPVVVDQSGAIIPSSNKEPQVPTDAVEITPEQPLPTTTASAPLQTQSPAATAPPAPASSSFDQDGVSAYSMIFAKIKEADSAYENSDFKTARSVYESALVDLKKLKESKPDFQPFIVEYRQRDIARKIKAIEVSLPK
ncbi:MAG: hypothetical protein SH807_02370 [Blastochloris sp.]|nr:hypothetical protein [Blastochloris sp.]